MGWGFFASDQYVESLKTHIVKNYGENPHLVKEFCSEKEVLCCLFLCGFTKDTFYVETSDIQKELGCEAFSFTLNLSYEDILNLKNFIKLYTGRIGIPFLSSGSSSIPCTFVKMPIPSFDFDDSLFIRDGSASHKGDNISVIKLDVSLKDIIGDA